MNIFNKSFRQHLTMLIIASSLLSFQCKKGNDDADKKNNAEYPEAVDVKANLPIQNPERGLFLESNYFVHNLKNPFQGTQFPQGWINDGLANTGAENDKISELQLYLYLTEYVGKDIPQEAFANMQKVFDDAKSHGYKFILRFAYDNNPNATQLTFNDIFRHLDQLEPFLQKNIGLIDIWQMGFIGAWGEGHSTPLRNDWANKTKMVKRILQIFSERQMSLRYPSDKAKLLLSEEEQKRIGYNNDYFTASEHPLAPENDYTFGSADYTQVKNASTYVKVEGEIPYAENTEWGLHKLISIPNTLKIFQEHHYDAFDVTQNNNLNIDAWKKFKVSARFMKSQKILFEDEYFQEDDGKYYYRTAYEFIRDHLGYRLYLDNKATSLKKNGSKVEYDIQFRNVGFAAIKNPRPVYLVFIDNSNNVVKSVKLDSNPKNWQPYDTSNDNGNAITHQIKGAIAVSLSGRYKVALWLPDPTPSLEKNALYAIQFANKKMEIWQDSKKEYKMNVIGEIDF